MKLGMITIQTTMLSGILLIALVVCITPVAAAGQPHQALSLADIQRLLRTDLDNELEKIAHDGSLSQDTAQLLDTSSIHSKQRSYVRKRSKNNQIDNSVPSTSSNAAAAAATHLVDEIWNSLVTHAWDTVESMHRGSTGSFIRTTNKEATIPCPFLLCAIEMKGQTRHSSTVNVYTNLLSAFNKSSEESLLVRSAHNETCGILTLSASEAHDGISKHNVGQHNNDDSVTSQQNIIAMPLVDVMKIHTGTVDEVSSLGWSVPYVNNSDILVPPNSAALTNATQKLNQWERLIIVDFSPGLGGMKEERELLDLVNTMMSDIQDMGEVGWLQRMNEQERQAYEIDESVTLVPALSEMFSLTATLNNITGVSNGVNTNNRVSFWNEAFARGIESSHACSEMFSTLFVKPRSGYYNFDLILNPADGPPPSDYDSSASNPACVASLVAGLSIHRESYS